MQSSILEISSAQTWCITWTALFSSFLVLCALIQELHLSSGSCTHSLPEFCHRRAFFPAVLAVSFRFLGWLWLLPCLYLWLMYCWRTCSYHHGSSRWGAAGLHPVGTGYRPCLCCGWPHLLAQMEDRWESFDGLTARSELSSSHGRLIPWISAFCWHTPVTTQTISLLGSFFQLLSPNLLPCFNTSIWFPLHIKSSTIITLIKTSIIKTSLDHCSSTVRCIYNTILYQ